MTTTLLIYDIPDDRLRSKVAEARPDYGLDRWGETPSRGPAGQGSCLLAPERVE